MALDVYVGTLTRYHRGDWENIAQRTAREQGIDYQLIRANPGEDDEPLDEETVRQAVLRWRDHIAEGINVPLDWDESASCPYFTDRPAWDGYASLLLWAAYEEHPEFERPAAAASEWAEDPAFLASFAEEFPTRYKHLLLNTEYWLPSDFPFVFSSTDAPGIQATFGSSIRLVAELEELNRRTWGFDDAERARCRYEGCDPGSTLERAAQFGYSVLHALALKSVEHRLVMKLDY